MHATIDLSGSTSRTANTPVEPIERLSPKREPMTSKLGESVRCATDEDAPEITTPDANPYNMAKTTRPAEELIPTQAKRSTALPKFQKARL